jgi:DNA repair exonuclease SbcCD nuclease subunit
LTENNLPSRLEEIIESVKWTVDLGKKHKATMFIGCGDIFDTSEKLNTKEGLAIMEMFKYIKSKYTNSFFLVGNHDQISSNYNILDLFSPIVKVFSKPSFIDVQGARLFFLPYLRDCEDVYSAFKEFETLNCPGKKYAFCHFWDSSVMSVDAEAVDLTKINLSMFDKVFLGHYHVPTADLSQKVIYLGTLLNKRFNETGPKGCWILDTDSGKLDFYKNPNSPEFFQLYDTNVLTDAENLVENAYYRIACDPEHVLEVTKLLSKVKGFELVSKQETEDASVRVSIMNIEKKNSSSLKDYILANCNLFVPEGITEEEFKEQGASFLAGL